MDDRNDDYLNEPLDLPGEPDTQDWSRSMPTHSWHKPAIIVGSIIVVLAGAGFAWMQLGQSSPADDTQEESALSEPEPVVEEESLPTDQDIVDVTDTETIRTRTPRVEFAHPTSWKVSDADGYVRVVSPEFTYTTSDSEVIENGVFRLHFRQGATEPESNYFGRGFASRPSETLTYSDPALGQREETNLSFFGLDNPNNFAYLLIAGNFSLAVGDTLGPDFANESDAYIIAGGYATSTLTEGIDTKKVPLDYFDTTNAYRQALDIIKSLKIL
jgi:hypothetical protein